MTTFPTDGQIARSVKPRPLTEVAGELGLTAEELDPCGRGVAKVDLEVLAGPPRTPNGRLILVSALTPTPAGEGKTTTTIGLAQALAKLGESSCVAIREPSLGPCMGLKGGGAGGGYCQVLPQDRINLHFTGDLHAVTSAHNLLAALVDNHLHHGNRLRLDLRRVLWRRVMDMNDRALRNVVVGLGGPTQGMPRETGFDITAASEVMATLCLARNEEDLKARLGRMIVGFDLDRRPITCNDFEAAGAMAALLRDALRPNLVQTIEGVPAFVHGGPFANIAHGCNSVIATKMGQHLAKWTITEAGFGFDLGAEKFLDIKCPSADLNPSLIVLVATVRALKMHGGVKLKELHAKNPDAVLRGFVNLEKHVESVALFGKKAVIALNEFAGDDGEELDAFASECERLGLAHARCRHFSEGGDGALDLARLVIEETPATPTPLKTLYDWGAPVKEKILAIAQGVYGAREVLYTKDARRALRQLAHLGFEDLPVCIAKTQNSLSDNPSLRGRPRDFPITVRALSINAGAGFIVAMTGEIMRMPGLPKNPLASEIDLVDGIIHGLS